MDFQSEGEFAPPPHSGMPIVKGWKKLLFLLAAGLFLVLGLLGIIIPGLPTTPFLLLTSYFLVRTSPELNRRLLDSQWVGPILTDWQVKGGVRRDVKVKSVVVVLLAVCGTIYVSRGTPWLIVIMILAASTGIFVIIRLPLIESNQPPDTRQ